MMNSGHTVPTPRGTRTGHRAGRRGSARILASRSQRLTAGFPILVAVSLMRAQHLVGMCFLPAVPTFPPAASPSHFRHPLPETVCGPPTFPPTLIRVPSGISLPLGKRRWRLSCHPRGPQASRMNQGTKAAAALDVFRAPPGSRPRAGLCTRRCDGSGRPEPSWWPPARSRFHIWVWRAWLPALRGRDEPQFPLNRGW